MWMRVQPLAAAVISITRDPAAALEVEQAHEGLADRAADGEQSVVAHDQRTVLVQRLTICAPRSSRRTPMNSW